MKRAQALETPMFPPKVRRINHARALATMSTSKVFALFLTAALAGGLAFPASAQEDVKKDEASAMPHCSPKIGKLCDKLAPFSQTGGETWKVAMYGATACSNSRALQTERRARRDRIEYEARLARAARENKQEHKAWVPSETNEQFNARTNGSCDGSYAHYCAEMRREAEALKNAEEKQAAVAFVDGACGSQTAAAAPAAAAPAQQRR
jgi:hypothetical protein